MNLGDLHSRGWSYIRREHGKLAKERRRGLATKIRASTISRPAFKGVGNVKQRIKSKRVPQREAVWPFRGTRGLGKVSYSGSSKITALGRAERPREDEREA